MKYIDFYHHFKNYPVIQLEDIKNIEPTFDYRRLYEWQKRGYLKRLTNNNYIFTDRDLTENEINFIANKIYGPSYLSLEYVLNYYSFIPEVVYWRTNVTTRKTKRLSTEIGNFSYQKIKNKLFFGYRLIKNDDIMFKIAEPEKAVLDFLYLRKDLQTLDHFYELRINKEVFKETIDFKKMDKYLKVFSSRKLSARVRMLIKVIS